MTPEEYLKIKEEQNAIIKLAEDKISDARDKADRAKPPIKLLRRAKAEDIRPGLIVWHDCGENNWVWHVIYEPRHYGDDWKAYVADDGCRYGLHGAWVKA